MSYLGQLSRWPDITFICYQETFFTISFRPVKRKLTGGWLNIIHLLTFKLKVGQLIFKKQLEHFWDDSMDPLNLSILQPRTIIMTGMVSEGVKIFQFVTPTHHPPIK